MTGQKSEGIIVVKKRIVLNREVGGERGLSGSDRRRVGHWGWINRQVVGH